jgi:hypothetical protein
VRELVGYLRFDTEAEQPRLKKVLGAASRSGRGRNNRVVVFGVGPDSGQPHLLTPGGSTAGRNRDRGSHQFHLRQS